MQTLITARHSANSRAHFRLLFSALVGVLVTLSLSGLDLATRILIGWNAGVAILLLTNWRMMARTTVSQLKRKAAQQDESAPIILGVMICAIVASLGGVLSEAGNARDAVGTQAALYVLLSIATLVLSWLYMQVLFATHYAHRYYGDRGNDESDCGGLIFPEPQAAPDYSEFLYFSFCIGMTYQVSDIMTRSRGFRRLVTLHGAVSFFFNTFVLALAVNLLGGFGAR